MTKTEFNRGDTSKRGMMQIKCNSCGKTSALGNSLCDHCGKLLFDFKPTDFNMIMKDKEAKE